MSCPHHITCLSNETELLHQHALGTNCRIFAGGARRQSDLRTGTTSTDENGNIVGAAMPIAQTMQVFRNIESVLKRAGAGNAAYRPHADVCDRHLDNGRKSAGRTTNSSTTSAPPRLWCKWRLIDPDLLVEVEVDAVVTD